MLLCLVTASASAQTFTVRHNFLGAPADGNSPLDAPVLAGSNLYGTTVNGGSDDGGAVFALGTDGLGFALVHSFSAGAQDPRLSGTTNSYVEYLDNYTNTDGTAPTGGLTLSGSALYGTAHRGGTGASGVIFGVGTSGTGFALLKTFAPARVDLATGNYTNAGGAEPYGGLAAGGQTLYGTTQFGGSGGFGTVFRLNTDGSGFAVLHNFTDTPDGAKPSAGLVLAGATLYGSTQLGGAQGNGLLFALDTNGLNFRVLHDFTNAPDGTSPIGGMVLAGDTLYGTTADGGSQASLGTVFRINTNGTAYSILHAFTGVVFPPANTEGAHPFGSLALTGGTLYGAATQEGSLGNGTLFSVNTNGSGFTVIKSFPPVDSNTYSNADGAGPYGGLVANGSALYGTAEYGGSLGYGVVFELDLATNSPGAWLGVQRIGSQIVLSWTNSGFSLQSAPYATGAYLPIAGATSPYTNPVTGASQFFRLAAP